MKQVVSFHKMYFLLVCVSLSFTQDVEGAFARGRVVFNQPRNQFFFNSVQSQNAFRNLALGSFNRNTGFVGVNGINNQFDRFNTNQRFDLVTGNSSFFNAGNLVNPLATTEVAGFSKLRELNKELVELDKNGIAQRLFISGNGELIGGAKPPEARTVQQLKEFYILNRDKFNGNQKALIDRFLARQGALSNGQFIVDIDQFPLDLENEFVKQVLQQRYNGDIKQMRRDLGRAALNYLLNTLQARFKIKIPKEKVNADGTVALNLAPFFRGEALALLQRADPTASCTGKIRLNALINFTLDPGNYYKFLNAPKNLKDLAAAYGVQNDKRLSNDRTLGVANKLFIGVDDKGVKESGVASGEQRILEVQNALNISVSSDDPRERSCYRSLDTTDHVADGEQQLSRSVKVDGVNFTHDAEEWLCLGSNGFMQGFLAAKDGELILKRAPAEIATGGILGPSIAAVASCLDCHSNGFIGGGPRGGKGSTLFYKDHRAEVSREPFVDAFGRTTTHQGLFTSPDAYFARTKVDTDIFARAREVTESEFKDMKGDPFKTLPILMSSHRKPITDANAATELGFGEGPGAEARAHTLLASANIKTREDFNAKYCSLLQNRTGLPNEVDDQIRLRQDQILHGF